MSSASGSYEGGFSLIEVLVALGIAAVALVALMGRLGSSADVQYTLSTHAVTLDVAMNLLQSQSLAGEPVLQERRGEVEVNGMSYSWRLWGEKTEVDGFIRQNVAVKAPGEPEFTMFLYRAI